MRLGIVGSEQAKFSQFTEDKAHRIIQQLINKHSPTDLVSGGCHLGGVDIYVEQAASYNSLNMIVFKPSTQNWEGYKARNKLIAENSDVVVCITVKDLPPGFKEGGWERYCYHCKTDQHIKSGGCWTVKYAQKLGKPGEIIVID